MDTEALAEMIRLEARIIACMEEQLTMRRADMEAMLQRLEAFERLTSLRPPEQKPVLWAN